MPSRIFAVTDFMKLVRKQKIAKEKLIDAVDRADRGLIYADLGRDVIKQTVGRPNEAPINGYRTIVGFKTHELAVFFYGFAKNDADNITDEALADYRQKIAALLPLKDYQLDELVADGALVEITRPAGAEAIGEEEHNNDQQGQEGNQE